MDRFAQGTPDEWFTWLRHNAPVYRHPEPKGPGFWVLSKHEDISAASRNNTLFSADIDNGGIVGLTEIARAPIKLTTKTGKNLALMDPPEHTPHRAALEKAFRPRSIAALEDQVRGVVNRVLDEALDKGEVDFIDEVAGQITLRVLAEMLGAEEKDWPRLYDLANMAVGADDPEFVEPLLRDLQKPSQVLREVVRAMREFGLDGLKVLPLLRQATASQRRNFLALYKGRGELQRYAQNLATMRRQYPGGDDDIVTKLVQADLDGEPMSDINVVLYLELFLTAGHETSRTAMAHGINQLLDNPAAYAELRDDPSLVPGAIEETLRWSTPVQYFRRAVMEDTEIRGQRIRRGDTVALWYLSGNRDEDVFENPFTFDIHRKPNRHLSFGGGGVHFCLGSKLARLEIQVLLEELTKRVPEMTRLGPAVPLRSNQIHGLKHLPVRLSERKSAQ
ncbi:cytochrome P450 [Mycobacterium kyogaense]|uniref:cytochrome P450 n=1 Tax=Mycobacterium kyogaense TaxID=2212479 RepID=UPI0013C532BB|nr:cytochrome P450 [Mycobacterium kyogaense]